MADQQQLENALRRAHAAGDTDAARRLVRAIKASRQSMSADAAPEAPQAGKSAAEMTPEELNANNARLTGTPEVLDPTEGVSGGQRFAAGGGKSLRDTGLGLVQSLSEGGPMAAGPMNFLRGMGVEMPRNRIKEWADNAIAANRPADDALMDTGAGLAGNVTGFVGQMLVPGASLNAASRVPRLSSAAPQLSAMSRLFMPTSVKGATLQGAAIGAAAPTIEGESRLANAAIGATGGAVGGVLPRVAGSALRGVNRIIEPLTPRGLENIAGRTIQRFATNPALQTLDDPILGRAPSLAEATLDPGIAQLQRAAQTKSPEVASALYGARVDANQGRVAALQKFAGTPAQRSAAMDAITTAENTAYAKVRSAGGVDVAPVIGRIDSILAGPEGKRRAVQATLTEAREAMLDAKGNPETSANMLLGARGAIRDLIEGRGENQAGKLAQRELIEVRDALDDAIAKVAPEIETALDARRLGMRPVNEMDTMAELIQRSTKPFPTQDGGMARGLLPDSFLRPTEDLDQLARIGTGFKKAQADNVLSPKAQETIDGVRMGLARQQFADNAGKAAGSPTAQFLAGQNIMDGITGQPNNTLLKGLSNLAAAALDKPYALVGVPERLNMVMARVLTNPKEAQAILAKLPAPDRALLEQAIGRLSAPAGAQFVNGRGE